MIETFNTTMALALSMLSGWAVMSHRVKDGIVIKSGLTLVSLGFLCSFFLGLEYGGLHAQAAASALVRAGLLICLAGYLLRTRWRGARSAQRRASDWRNTV